MVNLSGVEDRVNWWYRFLRLYSAFFFVGCFPLGASRMIVPLVLHKRFLRPLTQVSLKIRMRTNNWRAWITSTMMQSWNVCLSLPPSFHVLVIELDLSAKKGNRSLCISRSDNGVCHHGLCQSHLRCAPNEESTSSSKLPTKPESSYITF